MKAVMMMTSSGPMVVLSSHGSLTDPALLAKLKAKGIEKFIAYDLDMEDVQKRYGGHFRTVVQDLHETDDLRILDFNGYRIFELFQLSQLGEPVIYESAGHKTQVYVD